MCNCYHTRHQRRRSVLSQKYRSVVAAEQREENEIDLPTGTRWQRTASRTARQREALRTETGGSHVRPRFPSNGSRRSLLRAYLIGPVRYLPVAGVRSVAVFRPYDSLSRPLPPETEKLGRTFESPARSASLSLPRTPLSGPTTPQWLSTSPRARTSWPWYPTLSCCSSRCSTWVPTVCCRASPSVPRGHSRWAIGHTVSACGIRTV